VEAEAVTELKGKGMAYTEVPEAEIAELKRRMANELYKPYLTQYPATAPLFEKIQATA